MPIIRQTPLYIRGGLLGAAVLTTNIVDPRLGSAATLRFVIVDQITAALMIDQLGIFNLVVRDISLGRAAGAVLVLAGAIVVRLM